MRFFEFQTDEKLASAIMNTLNNLRGASDDDAESGEISFDALEQIMKNTGYPMFNFALFKKMYDGSELLKSVVSDFDEDKIVLNTKKQAEKDPAMDKDDLGSTDTVKNMAKRALDKRR